MLQKAMLFHIIKLIKRMEANDGCETEEASG